MVKGKPWSVEDENRLKQMLQADKSVRVIAKAMGKTRDCIRKKIARLELEVVVHAEKKIKRTTTSSVGLELPVELGSVEQILLMLSGALDSLRKGGLDKVEILRLRGIISGCKIFKELLVDYMDYRGLEVELMEWREKYAELAKKSKDVQAK